jgi:hypothetical protein
VKRRLRLLIVRPGRLVRPRVRPVLGRLCSKRSETKTKLVTQKRRLLKQRLVRPRLRLVQGTM